MPSSVPTSSIEAPIDSPTVPSPEVEDEERLSSPPPVRDEKRMKRVMDNFESLLSAYLDSIKTCGIIADEGSTGITFTEKFEKFNQYSRLKTLANLHYADSFFSSSPSIVSSIEFDKDDGIFVLTSRVLRYCWSDSKDQTL
jgi:hypothetical protein